MRKLKSLYGKVDGSNGRYVSAHKEVHMLMSRVGSSAANLRTGVCSSLPPIILLMPVCPMCLCSSFPVTHCGSLLASTLFIDVSTLVRQFSSSAALAGTNVPGLSPKAKLECTRALLSMLLTFGVSEGIDSICMEALSISPCPCSVGMIK